jgi:hypothetical protein
MMQRLIGAALTAAGMAGAVIAAPTANAYVSVVESYVWWTGVDCISVEYSNAPDDWGTEVGRICGGHSERAYTAVPGQFVGADPMPRDRTETVGCQVRVDGVLRYSDYAPPGDMHNVNCLHLLLPQRDYGYSPRVPLNRAF